VIYALRQPTILLGLLAGFLVAIPLRAALQRFLTGPAGPGRRGGLSAVGRRRTRRGWPGYLDPYGTVAAVLSGAGWGPRVEAPRTAGTDTLMLLSALAVHAALTALGLAAFVAAGGALGQLQGLDVSTVLHGSIDSGHAGRNVALGFAMVNLACGLLALVPIPPLELGVIVWSRLPRSPQARRVAYHVLEEQWGVAVLLLLLLLPLGGLAPPLLAVINAIGGDILDAL
jgi:hypothetical protein